MEDSQKGLPDEIHKIICRCSNMHIILTFLGTSNEYDIYHMYLDRQAWAASLVPDETPQNVHLILVYTLPTSSNFKTQHQVVNCTCSNFRTSMERSWGFEVVFLCVCVSFLVLLFCVVKYENVVEKNQQIFFFLDQWTLWDSLNIISR